MTVKPHLAGQKNGLGRPDVVSINFCGGCNPRIDRGRLAAALREALAAEGFDVVYNQTIAAFTVYLSGCTSGCAFKYRKNASLAPATAVAGASVDAVAVAEEDLAAVVVKKVKDYFARR